MSKIAEKKAEKLFPLKSIDGGEIEAYFNAGQLHKREIYIECYNQAFQDFLEKACDYLKRNYPSIFDTYQESGYNEIEKFKEYIES